MPTETEARDQSLPNPSSVAVVPSVARGRLAYSAPRLRSLGRVAELMRGSSGHTGDGHGSMQKP